MYKTYIAKLVRPGPTAGVEHWVKYCARFSLFQTTSGSGRDKR